MDNKEKKETTTSIGYFVGDIYWSDLTKEKQAELKAAGLTSTYVLDDTIPIAEVDEYYLEEIISDDIDYYQYKYGYTGYDKSNYGYTGSYSYTPKVADDDLALEDITKAARQVYWMLSGYLPDEGNLPADFQIGDIVEYLEQFYTIEQLQGLIDSKDQVELQELANDIRELFFNVDII